ncbi:Rrf2 family transcriptional regulator [Chromatium okenii]|uniref:Rrf2 family transcriptional regulator n=1 Tax=Chromatium okenii TaxID=61644 RepID=UPI0019075BBB|nr:Rrf2 family transcriptional regulator [Chromatium okenii]MBK1642463.1 Rrf2 family transcriptional regulator [Chromatium okenii]
MKLTTKGRYAVTAMLDLAIEQTQGPIPLADIAERQVISLSYLEQLFAKLRRCQLVRSVRGPGGGYLLTRPPAEISVADVIRAVDDNLDTTRCGGAGNCQNNRPCLTHALWYELNERIDSYLNAVNLQNLLDRHNAPPSTVKRSSQRAKIMQ